jgi:YjbE family integral membrane protein
MPEVNFDLNLADPMFWTGLLQIIVVNILLSGDNAVVIALAARSLPPQSRRVAVLGGSIGAVVLRIVFTLVIVWLMTIPYLKVLGGALLLWIGAQMLVPEHDGEGDGIKAHAGLWAAMRTIIVADAVMSLDNVLAIAAAAQGNFPLLLIGLLVSIPLVIFGSMVFLKLLDRFPTLVVAGAGLIGYIAGEVIVTDPAVLSWIDTHAHWLHYAGPIAGIAVVLLAGYLMKRRAEAKAGPLVDLAAEEK